MRKTELLSHRARPEPRTLLLLLIQSPASVLRDAGPVELASTVSTRSCLVTRLDLWSVNFPRCFHASPAGNWDATDKE